MLQSVAPTRKYFFLMFALSCVLLVVFTYITYEQFKMTEKRNQDVTHTYEVLGIVRDVLISNLNVETGQRGYLLSGRREFLDPYHASVNDVKNKIAMLDAATINSPHQQERVIELKKAVEHHQNVIKEHLERYRFSGTRFLTVEDLAETKASMGRIREIVNNIQDVETKSLTKRQRAAYKQEKTYRLTLFVGAGLGICALVIANLVIYLMLQRSKQSEEKFRATEARFKAVMDGVNDGIFEYDLTTQTFLMSPSHNGMLGYESEETVKNWDEFIDFVHPDDVEDMRNTIYNYVNGATEKYVNQFRMKHSDGSWRWMLSRGIGTRDRSGAITRLIGAHADITEQKRHEEELEQLNTDLEGFTYIASHDLRAPLVNLKGFASEVEHALNTVEPIVNEALRQLSTTDAQLLETALRRDIPESLSFINASVERMDKLTSAIVDMSRIGRRDYRRESVDCTEVVERCLGSLAHEIGNHDITVTYDELPTLITDPLAIEQIFGNLLDNAVKYLSPDRKGEIHIGVRMYSYEARFSISDNGRGIAENDLRKVFEIFRRAGNSGGVRGSGMGMAYVNATLRKLGGRIWLKSVLDEGTTFYFTIPIKNNQKETLNG